MKTERGSVAAADARRPLFLGVDVGGTNIKIGLIDDAGQVLGKTSIPTHADQQPDPTMVRVRQATDELLSDLGLPFAEIAAVGLGTPGTMDIPSGLMLDPPNLTGWHHYPVRDRLAAAMGRPVWFANDANAAAFGEKWIGSGQRFSSIVFLTLGTGVGGGIIIGDLSIDGENSCGSECGHIIIDYHETARMCGCGQHGHLEAYASATGVTKRAHEALTAGRPSSLMRRITAGETLSPLMISEEALVGDALSREIVLDTAGYLGIGITTLMHTVDPGAVILGGAMTFGGHGTPLGEDFLERIRAEVRRRAFPVLAEKTTIDFAALGSDAGFIGAAGIARAGLRKSAEPL